MADRQTAQLGRVLSVVAALFFVVGLGYLLQGWHYTRSAWSAGATKTAEAVLGAADHSFHEIGWLMLASATVVTAVSVLMLLRREFRLRLFCIGVAVLCAGIAFAGDRAADNVNTAQPCACDMTS